MNIPILTALVFIPIAGMLLIMVTPRSQERLIRAIATVATALVLLLSIRLLLLFNINSAEMQFVERVLWIPELQVHYHLGVDGISFVMVLATSLLSFLACVASFGIKERVKEYFVLYLLLETGMMGTFLALDLFLFYIFWELVLVPMYFLIGIWGGPRKEYAAIKFFLYTLAGSMFMLIGILALYFASTPHTFNMLELGKNTFAIRFQQLVFLALFLGFAIKVPIFPFHTWLPDAHVEAPTPISVLLAGVLLKMGAYGFYRISYPILPQAARWFGPYMGILAIIGIIYGGFVAFAQKDFKKMVAYSSVSHMGFVLLGLAVFTTTGMNGALLQMFNHAMITGGLFLLVGVLYDRSHIRDLDSFGGIWAKMPVYGGILIFTSLASLGLPGLAGFVSEFMVLLGSFNVYRWMTIAACGGILLAAAYLLYMIQRVLLGNLNPKWAKLPDINAREIFTMVPLMILILLIGIYPKVAIQYFSPTIEALVRLLGGTAA
ncbi:MAG: NADH-quinone oxidoreductase subunit M [Candidatus Omnitrophica bacterium]|nr:NADH-quinone oxidoreductase subunit M [Candidatus Omnitrophota bacterium]